MAKVEIIVEGKKYPCRPTMGAMLRYKRETGRDVTQMNQNELGDLCTFLWCCVCSACAHDGIEFGMDLITFADSISGEDVLAWAGTLDSGTGDSEKKSPSPSTN